MKKKAFFVHIPKTAGNSIRQCMRAENLLTNPGKEKWRREHHWGIKDAKRIKGQHLSFKTDTWPCYLEDPAFDQSDLTFTAVRNPYSLLWSYYIHYIDLRSTPKKWLDDGWANVNGYHQINSFEHFIDMYTSIDPEDWHVPSLCRNLYGQIFDKDNASLLDRAIYLENLQAGIISIVKELGRTKKITLKLPHRNKSPRADKKYIEVYNEDMIKKVAKKCEWELDTFGYSFNSRPSSSIKDIKNLVDK
jgi:hypothetical protein